MSSCLLFVSMLAQAAWRDPSPHEVRFIAVEPSVRLEVLDWGGSGRPIVFVGCYLSAHVYDDIGPKLTNDFHVFAVTRRGVGKSDRPPTGYDAQRRADDVAQVIAGLEMHKPILVGNSCGGGILHTLGSQHPDLGGLVYLDAAEDPTLTMSDYGVPEFDPARLPPRIGGPPPVVFPEAERRLLTEMPIAPTIRKAIVEDNNVRPEYGRIRVPVLAVYRTTTLQQALREFPPRNDAERAVLEYAVGPGQRAKLAKWKGDLLAGVPTARIVELPEANLYMFLSNEADIIREIRSFAATLN
jgi:pimeloyl-ACP methyl ester carboxylesterase